jgi:hypothetical protein
MLFSWIPLGQNYMLARPRLGSDPYLKVLRLRLTHLN